MNHQQRIAKQFPRMNSRHIEAWMRSECGTLDALSVERFAFEASCAMLLARAEPEMSEQLARSYGI